LLLRSLILFSYQLIQVSLPHTTIIDVQPILDNSGNVFVNHLGPASQCYPPAPSSGCHKFIKVTYSHDCSQLASIFGLMKLGISQAGQVDNANVFDPATGAVRVCQDYVTKTETFGYSAPASSPRSCSSYSSVKVATPGSSVHTASGNPAVIAVASVAGVAAIGIAGMVAYRRQNTEETDLRVALETDDYAKV
jgi:hypothetical protein